MMDDRPIGSYLFLIAVGLAALTAACASSTDQPPSDTATRTDVVGEAEVATGGPLRVGNRSELSICVDGAGGLNASDDEVDRVRDALEAVLADADNPPPEYSDPAVSLGCPPPVALTGELFSYFDRYGLVSSRGLSSPAYASRHRLHVYMVPPDVYAASFGDGWAYATTGEEITCRVHVCPWVTQGVYITPSTGSDVLSRALRDVLVLFPLLPEPAEYSQFCLSETREQWCARYNYCQVFPADARCEDYGAVPTPRPETPLSPER